MITKELEHLVQEQRKAGAGTSYMRNVLKEYLQMYLLYFVYSSPKYSPILVFTGGTCLRQFFGLERLSEDVDFDLLSPVDPVHIKTDLESFFVKKYKYNDVQVSLKQQGRQLLLKFPVLKLLSLAKDSESDLLYVKMDLSPNPSRHYNVITTSKNSFGFNFVAVHYDLPSLMAGKVHAVLTRQHFRGKDDVLTLKGRDYFDLLWYLKKAVQPNIKRLSDMLGEHLTPELLVKKLDQKVTLATTRHRDFFKADITPLLKNADMVPAYVQNYQAEYMRCRGYLLG
ncbi:MAG: nucleotidyl transferase AbiEii/AbiGii toxin family protein [Deltaproteobacteria bacterium]|nr:nucleotidyl transferase AbiEii/AbiGii toxin family protein [Deltaproteobacteria bacterium]